MTLSYICDVRLSCEGFGKTGYESLNRNMAIHKKEAFTLKDQELAMMFKAFSHPARIAILKLLAGKNECICGEIVLELPLAQSTISQHLKELKNAGLIKGEVDGPRTCYCLNHQNLEKIFSGLDALSTELLKNEAPCPETNHADHPVE